MDETLSLCVNFLVYKASEPLAPKVAMSPRDAQRATLAQAKWLQMVLCCPQGLGAEVALLLGRQKTSGEERQVLWEVDTRSPPC
jgi:hypothetical protein